jgi:hypothetical protein
VKGGHPDQGLHLLIVRVAGDALIGRWICSNPYRQKKKEKRQQQKEKALRFHNVLNILWLRPLN